MISGADHDEPASGLDPRARVEIRELLSSWRRWARRSSFQRYSGGRGRNLHLHIGIIEAGQMIAQGSMEDMRAQLQPHREITVTVKDTETAARVRSTLAAFPGVIGIKDLEPKAGRSLVRIDFTGDDDGVAAMSQALAAGGIAVLGFTEETKDLEAIFMRVTKGIVT
ncbi:MAG: hypothetical protein U0670_18645 [Anaerolineae bacterium]